MNQAENITLSLSERWGFTLLKRLLKSNKEVREHASYHVSITVWMDGNPVDRYNTVFDNIIFTCEG